MIKTITFLCLFLLSQAAISQISFGISIGGIGYHPIEEKNYNSENYDWKIDRKGKFVGYAAVSFIFSYRLNDYVGLKMIQTIVPHDCAGKFAGLSHIGIDFHDDIIGLDSQTDQLSFSFGPLFYYRKNWSQMPGYTNNPNFMKIAESGIWEKKFVWYGGQIEYNHYINTKDAFSLTFLPGYPYIYTFELGVKHTY